MCIYIYISVIALCIYIYIFIKHFTSKNLLEPSMKLSSKLTQVLLGFELETLSAAGRLLQNLGAMQSSQNPSLTIWNFLNIESSNHRIIDLPLVACYLNKVYIMEHHRKSPFIAILTIFNGRSQHSKASGATAAKEASIPSSWRASTIR